MFNVGDRVRLVRDDGPYKKGEEGVITPKPRTSGWVYDSSVQHVQWAGGPYDYHFSSYLETVGPETVEEWRL